MDGSVRSVSAMSGTSSKTKPRRLIEALARWIIVTTRPSEATGHVISAT